MPTNHPLPAIERQSILVKGCSDKTMEAKRQIATIETKLVRAINSKPFFVLNIASIGSLFIALLVINISFTQKSVQLFIIVIAAIPSVIQFVVSIWLLCSAKRLNDANV